MSVDQTEKKLGKFFEGEMARIERMFGKVGEGFINDARLEGDYKDQTGNLRSSIGYGIGLNGQTETIKPADLTLQGFKGKAAAQEYGEQLLAEETGKGIVLVGFAGMEYAKDVENRKKDVVTGAGKRATRKLRMIMNKGR